MAIHSQYPDIHIPQDVSLPQFMLNAMASHPADQVAIVDHMTGRSLTYGQLAHSARCLAAGLQKQGLRKGEVVAIMCPNLPEFPVVLLGVALAGGILTPVNPVYTAKELRHQLEDSKARYLIAIPQVLLTVATTGYVLSRVFTLGDAPGLTPLSSLLTKGTAFEAVTMDPQKDVVVLPYSSGTTGLPKGVCLTHYNIVSNLSQLRQPELFKFQGNDSVVGLLPFFHIYGLSSVMLNSLQLGVRVVTLPKFEPKVFLEALAKHKVTIAHLAPPLIVFLAKHPLVAQHDLSALREIISGAAPLGQEVAEACTQRLGCSLRQGFGMTEMSPVSHVLPIGVVKYASVGRLLPNMVMKLVDVATGELVPTGTRGEMLLKGPNVMQGYLNNAEATAATLDMDGFLHTGDVAYIDADGDCFVVDRCKELIKVKGFQVAPAELEDLLQTHPAIADCGVIGIQVKGDEAPKAFVVLKTGYTRCEQLKAEIIDFAAQNSAPYKRLNEVEFVNTIPKAASGKILRRELRALQALADA